MPKIPIGFAARLFDNKRTAIEEIQFAETNNFESLQFRGPENGLDEPYLRANLESVSTSLQQSRIIPTLELLIGLDETGRTPSGKSPLEILKTNLPAIQKLSIQYVHWHLYPAAYETIDKKSVCKLENGVVPEIKEATTLAEDNDFTFGIENNAPEAHMFVHPDRCINLLDKVPDLKLVWDMNHTLPNHAQDFLSIANRMSMIHVSDTPLPETNHHLPLGLGNIDFSAYVQQLQTNGFSGPAIFEIGGLPISGGYDRDTDDALVDSRNRLAFAIKE